VATSGKRPASRWARLGFALACLLLVPAGGTLVALNGTTVLGGVAAAAGLKAKLDGPLNLLLAGIDPRGSHTKPLADAIIVAHVPADRRDVYLFSIPRDLVVWIPAFAESGTPGQRGKINSAMVLGSQVGNGEYRPAQGFRLLTRTVHDLTGISFDGGAIINFGGFHRLVDILGGVSMTIDQDVVSEHKKPDGSPRDRLPECSDGRPCLRPYTGPQKIYPRSDRPVRLKGWEALDFVRQRYGLPRSDYDRQRHQRQFLRAVAEQATSAQLVQAIGTVGAALTVVDGGHGVLAWATELSGLGGTDLTTVDLPGEALFENGRYLGEQYTGQRARSFFAAVAEDRVRRHLRDHPGLVDR
jgi:LCP family protein required for cell wall assembly